MTKRVLGVLAALTMVVGSIACSSSSDSGTGTPAKDSGTGTDAKSDSGSDVVVVPGDSATDTGPTTDNTVGKACMDDSTCDVTGNGVAHCSKGLFGGSSGGSDLYPDNVCFATGCDAGDGMTLMGCDNDLGICLKTSSSSICLPACSFDDSTAAPKGCIGKDVCNVAGWGTDKTTMKPIGAGYCFGGCKADSDCGSGQQCQKEEGLCLKMGTVVTYTKTLGTACTDADSTAPAKCNCLYATSTKKGYCSQACRMGESGSCPTGFLCDAQLPKTKVLDSDVVFTAAPAGLSGSCLKTCTTDADCTAINGYCDENAGVGGKTCQIGAKRCKATTDCPTGQTCTGASATAAGSCG